MKARNIFTWFVRWAWEIIFNLFPPQLSYSASPRLSYAGLCAGIKKPSSGGNVKLALLDNAFPEQTQAFNLLYLVSSGLGSRREAWAEHCLKNGIRLIWNQNGVAYPAWAAQDFERLNRRMARLMNKADFVVYQSDFCKTTADQFLGPCRGKSAVIYNAVDTTLFTPTGRVNQKPSDALRLLVMGSHFNASRVLRALETLSVLREAKIQARLTIAGKLLWPKATQEIAQTVRRLNLADAVSLLPAYSQEQAPEIYRSADILLHLKYADPCPTVVIEAMACGLAVVGSASGGVPELVGTAAGELIKVPQDLKELYVPDVTDILTGVTKVASQLSHYSAAARQRAVERFDKTIWLKRHTEVFERVLGGL